MHNSIKIISKKPMELKKSGFSTPNIYEPITNDICNKAIIDIGKLQKVFLECKTQGYDYEYFPIRIRYNSFKSKTKSINNERKILFGKKSEAEKVFTTIEKETTNLGKVRRKTQETYIVITRECDDILKNIKNDMIIFRDCLLENKINSITKENLQTIISILHQKSGLKKNKIKALINFLTNFETLFVRNNFKMPYNKYYRYINLEKDIGQMIKKLHVSETFFIEKGLNLIEKNDLSVSIDEINFKNIIFSESIEIGSKFQKINEEQKNLPNNTYDFVKEKNNDKTYPIVGVIDSPYFGENKISSYIISDNTYSLCKENHKRISHGAKISNLIAANDELNSSILDNCGNVVVKHFGICLTCAISYKLVLKQIYQIIQSNPKIKIWNLSMNIVQEADQHQISFFGAVLDHIQKTKNILIVTGVGNTSTNEKIAVVADSVMSLTVSGVDINEQKWRSSREGYDYHESYLMKPDVSYFAESINTVDHMNNYVTVSGVSFATALISRKAAYLYKYATQNIYLIKAFIINAAAVNSHSNDQNFKAVGFGICPKDIKKVIKSEKHEIKIYFDDKISLNKSIYAKIPMTFEEKFSYIPILTFVYYSDLSPDCGFEYVKYEINPTLGFETLEENKYKNLGLSMPNTHPEEFENEEKISKNFGKYKLIKHREFPSSSRAKKYPASHKKDLIFTIDKQFRQKEDANQQDIPFGAVLTLKHVNNVDNYSDFKTRLATRIGDISYQPLVIEDNINITNELNSEIKFE